MHTLLALALASAFVLSPEDPTVIVEPDRVVYAKTTALEFSTAYVDGIKVKPATEYLRARAKVRFRNLIELRGTFRPELAATVGALR